VIEVGWTTAFGANWRDVAVLLALTALFAVRPQGIVALPGPARPRRLTTATVVCLH
jgi:hypothetical protein